MDIVGFGDAGVWVALANGSGGFNPPQFVLPAFDALAVTNGRRRGSRGP